MKQRKSEIKMTPPSLWKALLIPDTVTESSFPIIGEISILEYVTKLSSFYAGEDVEKR